MMKRFDHGGPRSARASLVAMSDHDCAAWTGTQSKFIQPEDSDLSRTGTAESHHLGEPEHFCTAISDAEGLGAKKGKAKKKFTARRDV